MAETVQITDANFDQEIKQADTPAVVMFKSTGCPHCKKMLPVFEETAGEYADNVKFGVSDVSEGRESATGFGIMGVPTMVLMKGGELVDKVVGAVPKEKLKSAIDEKLL